MKTAMTMMTSVDPLDLLVPPIIALIVLVLGYLQARIARRGKPLTPILRKVTFYAPILLLGVGYAMAFHDQLAAFFHWGNAWIGAMIAWALVLAAIAWTRRGAGRKNLDVR